jgi:hypothetical protein
MHKQLTAEDMNVNALRGMCCPCCGHQDSLRIEMTCTEVLDIYDDGNEAPSGDTIWGNQSYCECPECDFQGTVGDFTFREDPRFKDDDGGERAAAYMNFLQARWLLLACRVEMLEKGFGLRPPEQAWWTNIEDRQCRKAKIAGASR